MNLIQLYQLSIILISGLGLALICCGILVLFFYKKDIHPYHLEVPEEALDELLFLYRILKHSEKIEMRQYR